MVSAQSLSRVQLFATPWTVAQHAPLSMEFLPQARILEWVAIFYFKGSSQPRDQTQVSCVSCIGRQILYLWAIREAILFGKTNFCLSLVQRCNRMWYSGSDLCMYSLHLTIATVPASWCCQLTESLTTALIQCKPPRIAAYTPETRCLRIIISLIIFMDS